MRLQAAALQNPSGYIFWEINRSRLFFFFLSISIQTLCTCSHLASLWHFKAIKLLSHVPIMASTGFISWCYTRRHSTPWNFQSHPWKSQKESYCDHCWMLTNGKLLFDTQCHSSIYKCHRKSLIEMTEEGHFSARVGESVRDQMLNFPSKSNIYIYIYMLHMMF